MNIYGYAFRRRQAQGSEEIERSLDRFRACVSLVQELFDLEWIPVDKIHE